MSLSNEAVPITFCSESTRGELAEYLSALSIPDATRESVQECIHHMTRLILEDACPAPQATDSVVLIPILRAGMAMYSAANAHFSYPETTWLVGYKDKGTSQVGVDWPKPIDIGARDVILLDPILATGDTTIAAAKTLESSMNGDGSGLTVVSCYAAPEGMKAIKSALPMAKLIVGCVADTVDPNGYLQPPTNGDMGDKLYGPRS